MSENSELFDYGILSSRPLYMSIIRTIDGKPSGYPIWNTFVNSPYAKKLDNEVMASTLLSLAKTLSTITQDIEKDGKFMSVTLDQKSYNIFSPYEDSDFQISFVVVFEERDDILIKNEHKEELTRKLVENLSELPELREFLSQDIDKPIENLDLKNSVERVISVAITKWDKKRVKILKEKRKQIEKEIEMKQKELEELENQNQENNEL